MRGAKGRRVIVIVDHLRVHHAKAVQEWLENNRDLIRVEYLPAYSPETFGDEPFDKLRALSLPKRLRAEWLRSSPLNPDEYLNSDLKASDHRRRRPRDMAILESKPCVHISNLSAANLSGLGPTSAQST